MFRWREGVFAPEAMQGQQLFTMGCVISGPDVAVAAPQPPPREDPPRPERAADRERNGGGGRERDRAGQRDREQGEERKGKEREKEKQQKAAPTSTSVVTWEAGRVPCGVAPHFVPARCGPFATDETIPPQTPAVGAFVVCLGNPAVAADGTTPASPIPPRVLPPGVADSCVFRASHAASVPGTRGVGAVIHDGSNLLPFAAANGDALDAGAPFSLRGFFPSALASVCVGVARPAVEVTSLARNGFVCREETEVPDAATARRRRRLFLYPYRVRAVGLFVHSGSATVTRAATAHAGAFQGAETLGGAMPGAFATWVLGESMVAGEIAAVGAIADRQRAAIACYALPPAPQRTKPPKRARRQKVVNGPEGESLVPASSDEDALSSSDGDNADIETAVAAAAVASGAANSGVEWVSPSAARLHPAATRETSFGFTLAAPIGVPRNAEAAARLIFGGAASVSPIEAAWARFLADLPPGRHAMTLELRFEYPANIYHAVWTGARKQRPLVASADGRDINISGAPLKRVGVFVRASGRKEGSVLEPGHAVSDALASATLLFNVTEENLVLLRARGAVINGGG